MSPATLPPDIVVLERGWLSSNNILLLGPQQCALVDSGYGTHAAQTVALVQARLGVRPLDLLVNTHLHSDHCGGNAALQTAYPALLTHIPPGQAAAVRGWDEDALSYVATGQYCPRFTYDEPLTPGNSIRLGARDWDIHAAPGHDPDSVILFQPELGILISADALWANGFGVVFPEIEGVSAFAEVGQTLDLIDALRPRLVIPGHGAVLHDVPGALGYARQRLDQFTAEPLRHARYAAKVLLKFKLLEVQQITRKDLLSWARATSYFSLLQARHYAQSDFDAWIDDLIQDLLRSGAAQAMDISGEPGLLNQ
ncbi:MAG: MBL fold metallo-hydrolase [Hylemonella sp.]|nr:MBL fold metallo-hydrolase [Hylemonella sp.]